MRKRRDRMRGLMKAVGTATALLAARAFAASSTPTIVVGTDYLIPNRANQTLQIYVTGGEAVHGLNFNVEIAGGGTAYGGTAGPEITNIDLVTGTIFASDNNGQVSPKGQTYPAQALSASVATNTGTTVNASGLLATLTIDTTGYTGTAFTLDLTGFSNDGVSGNTDFGYDSNYNPVPANVTNGYVVATVPGDANLDGTVNFADLLVVTQNYKQPGTFTWQQGDVTGDGSVNFADLLVVSQNYGQSVNLNSAAVPSVAHLSALAVPEPTTGSLLALSLAALLGWRPRRTNIADHDS